MQSTMNNIKNLVEVNNIVGEPIVTPDGQTIIPVSKLSFGFGGADEVVSQETIHQATAAAARQLSRSSR